MLFLIPSGKGGLAVVVSVSTFFWYIKKGKGLKLTISGNTFHCSFCLEYWSPFLLSPLVRLPRRLRLIDTPSCSFWQTFLTCTLVLWNDEGSATYSWCWKLLRRLLKCNKTSFDNELIEVLHASFVSVISLKHRARFSQCGMLEMGLSRTAECCVYARSKKILYSCTLWTYNNDVSVEPEHWFLEVVEQSWELKRCWLLVLLSWGNRWNGAGAEGTNCSYCPGDAKTVHQKYVLIDSMVHPLEYSKTVDCGMPP